MSLDMLSMGEPMKYEEEELGQLFKELQRWLSTHMEVKSNSNPGNSLCDIKDDEGEVKLTDDLILSHHEEIINPIKAKDEHPPIQIIDCPEIFKYS